MTLAGTVNLKSGGGDKNKGVETDAVTLINPNKTVNGSRSENE